MAEKIDAAQIKTITIDVTMLRKIIKSKGVWAGLVIAIMNSGLPALVWSLFDPNGANPLQLSPSTLNEISIYLGIAAVIFRAFPKQKLGADAEQELPHPVVVELKQNNAKLQEAVDRLTRLVVGMIPQPAPEKPAE